MDLRVGGFAATSKECGTGYGEDGNDGLLEDGLRDWTARLETVVSRRSCASVSASTLSPISVLVSEMKSAWSASDEVLVVVFARRDVEGKLKSLEGMGEFLWVDCSVDDVEMSSGVKKLLESGGGRYWSGERVLRSREAFLGGTVETQVGELGVFGGVGGGRWQGGWEGREECVGVCAVGDVLGSKMRGKVRGAKVLIGMDIEARGVLALLRGSSLAMRIRQGWIVPSVDVGSDSAVFLEYLEGWEEGEEGAYFEGGDGIAKFRQPPSKSTTTIRQLTPSRTPLRQSKRVAMAAAKMWSPGMDAARRSVAVSEVQLMEKGAAGSERSFGATDRSSAITGGVHVRGKRGRVVVRSRDVMMGDDDPLRKARAETAMGSHFRRHQARHASAVRRGRDYSRSEEGSTLDDDTTYNRHTMSEEDEEEEGGGLPSDRSRLEEEMETRKPRINTVPADAVARDATDGKAWWTAERWRGVLEMFLLPWTTREKEEEEMGVFEGIEGDVTAKRWIIARRGLKEQGAEKPPKTSESENSPQDQVPVTLPPEVVQAVTNDGDLEVLSLLWRVSVPSGGWTEGREGVLKECGDDERTKRLLESLPVDGSPQTCLSVVADHLYSRSTPSIDTALRASLLGTSTFLSRLLSTRSIRRPTKRVPRHKKPQKSASTTTSTSTLAPPILARLAAREMLLSLRLLSTAPPDAADLTTRLDSAAAVLGPLISTSSVRADWPLLRTLPHDTQPVAAAATHILGTAKDHSIPLAMGVAKSWGPAAIDAVREATQTSLPPKSSLNPSSTTSTSIPLLPSPKHHKAPSRLRSQVLPQKRPRPKKTSSSSSSSSSRRGIRQKAASLAGTSQIASSSFLTQSPIPRQPKRKRPKHTSIPQPPLSHPSAAWARTPMQTRNNQQRPQDDDDIASALRHAADAGLLQHQQRDSAQRSLFKDQ